jgi:hypothetical protein
MIVGGLWWLEQWHKWHAPYYQYADDSPEGMPASVLYASMTGVAPALAIGVSPYAQLQRVTMGLEDYVANRGYQGRQFRFSMSQGKFLFGRSLSKRMALRMAAKVGARFVPGVGWALLVVDAWAVGKWLGEKTNPFD